MTNELSKAYEQNAATFARHAARFFAMAERALTRGDNAWALICLRTAHRFESRQDEAERMAEVTRHG